MANPHKGDVAFEAEGRSYTLRFSANAIVALEDCIDKPISEISALLGDVTSLRMKNVRAVFWAGLTDHHPDVTAARAGQIIDAVGFGRAVELIGLAFSRAFPDTSGEANPPMPGQDRDGTGSAS